MNTIESMCKCCVHAPVCSLRDDMSRVIKSTNELQVERTDGRSIALGDIPWIKLAKIECLYYLPKNATMIR